MTTGIGIDKATEVSPRDFERLLLRTLSAMRKGDFKVRMPVEFTGGAGKIADTLNDILELSQRSAEEVEKIATVVGKEGKLNQRASLALRPGKPKRELVHRGPMYVVRTTTPRWAAPTLTGAPG